MNTLGRRCVAEFIGTAGIVFGPVALAAGTQPSLGLLAGAITGGLAILIMVAVTGPISGGHVNPAVTLGLATSKKFPWKEVPYYWISQILGAFVAAGLVLVLFHSSTAGVVEPAVGVWHAVGIEACVTFMLVFTVLGTATNPKVNSAVYPYAIGFAITVGSFAAGASSGGAMNPARALGPALVHGGYALTHVWIYILGPCIGGIIASCAYEAIRERAATAPPAGAD